MSRPQRSAAARSRSYREASDGDDPMQDDDEAPLSSFTTRPRSTAAKPNGATAAARSRSRSRGHRTHTAELNDEIERDDDGDEEEHDVSAWNAKTTARTTRNQRLPFEAVSRDEVLLLDDDDDGDEVKEQREEEQDKEEEYVTIEPRHRPRRASAGSSARSRQRRTDPLQDEVEDDDEDAEFEHEKALLPQRHTRTAGSRASPSPPSTRTERVLSSGIELRRRLPNVDYRKTKIDRQSFYTPKAWSTADKQQQNGAAQSAKDRAGSRRGKGKAKKQYEDDLFELDEADEEEADEEEKEADEEADEQEENEEDDALSFSHLQHGNRRSERTLGKKIDYSNHVLDEAIRSVYMHDLNSRQRKQPTTGTKREHRQQKKDADEMEQDGEEDDGVQPMTDSDVEGYQGRRGRARQAQAQRESAEEESAEDTPFRLQAEQYMEDGFIPTKLLAMRRVADDSAAKASTQPSTTSSSSSSALPSTSIKYLVKWRDRAYKHSCWVDERVLLSFPGEVRWHVKGHITRLQKVLTQAGVDVHSLSVYRPEQLSEQEDGSVVELEDNQFYNPDFNQVHRVVSHRKQDGRYLVKWKGLGYDELTWETVADIDNDAEIERYHRYSRLPNRTVPTIPRPLPQPKVREMVDKLTFENDRELREYQKEGVSWMCFNWLQGLRPSLLADEMGLGKTAQTIAVCRFMQQYYNMRGPFLVIAPLSTVGHWQREFETWTDMNAVVYHGTQQARATLEQYEFRTFEHDGRPRQHKSLFRFNVLIVPDSMVQRERRLLCKINWPLMVIDEGHRIKNHASYLAQVLSEVSAACKILLTGTPIQNHLGELWSVLHFLDPDEFPWEDEFRAEYEEVANGSTTHLEALQQRIEPYFLRRIKEDVEKNIPPRRETLIEVDLSRSQKLHYKALYEKDVSKLQRGRGADLPSLMNLQMQLRKCCQHPFLLKGVEDTAMQQAGLKADDHAAILQMMVQHSGKFVLLKKMLDRLKEEGRRVLLFSQMTRLLDLVEDAMRYWHFLFERIDGNITGNERQAAIDRFCRPNSDRFVFLLSTKAGGLGLNLQVADTIIIFDSDWNPQNDLQAIARSHRIGQTKEVQVYRLIARNTYENEMFERASRKLGLGHAIMGSMQSSPFAQQADEPFEKLNKAELELMLRKGYYHQAVDATVESTQLTEDTIEQIIQRDAKVIEYRATSAAAEADAKDSTDGGASDRGRSGGSNRFAKASFITADSEAVGDWNDEDFWKKMFPDAATEVADGLTDDAILTGKRKRRMLYGSYQHLLQGQESQGRGKRQRAASPAVDEEEEDEYQADSQQQSSDDSVASDEPAATKKGKQALSEVCKRASLIPHGLQGLLEAALCRFGYGRWREIRADMLQRVTQNMADAAADIDKHPSLGLVQLQEASRVVALVERMSVDDPRAYVVGWLKMCYLYSNHKALYASDSEGDSDNDTVSKKRLRRTITKDGTDVELHASSQLAEDARQLIEDERSLKRMEKKRVQKQKALAAIDAVSQTMADIVRSKSPQPPPAGPQTASLKLEVPTEQIKHELAPNASAVKDEAVTKTEYSNGVKAENGQVKAEEKQHEEDDDEEDEEEEVDGRSFLELFHLIPVDSTLLTPHQHKYLKSTAKSFIGTLQLLHTLNWYVLLEDNVLLSHPPHDAASLQAELNIVQKGKAGRFQWLYENMNRWWMPEDDWWLLLGMRLHGLDQFDKIRDDPRLPFAARLSKQETLTYDDHYSEVYRQLYQRFQQLYDSKAPKVQVDLALQRLQKAATREETVTITWPDSDCLSAYTKKLLAGVRKVHRKTALRRVKEQERKRKEEQQQAELERQREEERKRMEKEARADEDRARRKKEKKAAKERAKQKEREARQQVNDGRSKADNSLAQMLVKRGERVAVIQPEDDIADELDAAADRKQRKIQRDKQDGDKSARVQHSASSSSKPATPLRHSASSSSSKKDRPHPSIRSYFTSPSQRMKPLPLIDVNAAAVSPSIVSTASPASSSASSPSTRSPLTATATASSAHSKPAAGSGVPDLFGPSKRGEEKVTAAAHPGLGVRRIEWREDDGRDDGDVELSMDEDEDEEQKQRQRREAAAHSKRLPSGAHRSSSAGRVAQPGNLDRRVTRQRNEIVIDDDDGI